MELKGKVLIAQGGGPTAVINQSMVGAVLESRKFPQVTKVYGALHGIDGILNEEFIDLTKETTNNLEKVARTPSSALFSTRSKANKEKCVKMFEVMKAHDIRYFFYIGGNDSAETLHIVSEQADKEDYELRCIHIPKTIDNDLVLNDHTPGFGSAARFVAQAFTGVNLDNSALGGIFIGVVMGRNSGFLTASSALAQKYPDDGPHLIYCPENPFSRDQFVKDVKAVYDRLGRCVIAVSEGIIDATGLPMVAKLMEQKAVELDDFGHRQLSGTGVLGDALSDLIRDRLNIKRVRADTFGYMQRSFIGCVSDVDQSEAREVGEKAAQFAIWNDVDGSITIERTGDYSVDYQLQPLEEIAAKTKVMEADFFNEEKNHVTKKFKNYCRPLLGSNVPQPHRLRAPKVDKENGHKV
jgi:6-phosphofructokinase 1